MCLHIPLKTFVIFSLLNTQKNNNSTISWILYIKEINSTQCRVDFSETNAKILFKTDDQKFLKENNADDQNAIFELNVEFYESVQTSKCHYKVTKFYLEIVLEKINHSIKWPKVLKPNLDADNLNKTQSTLVRKDDKQNIKQRFNVTKTHSSPSASPPPSSEKKLNESENVSNSKTTAPLQKNVVSENFNYCPTGLAGLCGLVNLGNTCYMNAAIQFIANATDIRNYFIGILMHVIFLFGTFIW